ncbi:Zinc finger, C2H2 domain and Zinc finger, C2H2-like domain-containing protein [Strongyloides ratti]|uniref:Zinc finger, C2H2 domain and Zinc finger, C2H2-like domain-containing protein n=1 Tax=Strongyloides ratti TaxID=34506 RepID=A0A090LID9_STRRB|nr:Zinc finger, C2H2 domain and Zinc finger, C2H2-like domain-containing protein [Strongyloides ratti]CEF67235.1 Zinc finger, C2H2 domain and Zinc finger, C2H2-like domain-containing protein [Strongyloides ratti]
MDIIDLRTKKPNNSNTFYCFICEKNYSNKEKIYTHFQNHFKYKPYICYDCDLSFIDNINLEEHSQESNHLNCGIKRNYKFEYFLNYFTGLYDFLEEVSEEEIKKLNFIMVDNSSKEISNLLNAKDNSIDKSRIFKFLNRKEQNDFSTMISFPDNIDKNSCNITTIDKIDSERNCSIPYSSNTIVTTNSVEKKIKSPKKMRNTGYLDVGMLSKLNFAKKHYISRECKCCKIAFVTENLMIKHVFQFHLKLNDYNLLKCAICHRKNKNSRNYLDFESIRNHFINNTMYHKGIPFVNNLSCNYNGRNVCVYIDGDFDILEKYEKQFEECFVCRPNPILQSQPVLPIGRDSMKRNLNVNHNIENVKKRKVDDKVPEVIVINDNDNEDHESNSNSDIEELYCGPPIAVLQNIPSPPPDLTLIDDIKPKSPDELDKPINSSILIDDKPSDLPSKKNDFLENLQPSLNKLEKNISSKGLIIAGAESISDDDTDYQPVIPSDQISKQKEKLKKMPSESLKLIVSGCEPISDDDSDILPLSNNDSNNDKIIKKNINVSSNKDVKLIPNTSKNLLNANEEKSINNTFYKENVYPDIILDNIPDISKKNNSNTIIKDKNISDNTVTSSSKSLTQKTHENLATTSVPYDNITNSTNKNFIVNDEATVDSNPTNSINSLENSNLKQNKNDCQSSDGKSSDEQSTLHNKFKNKSNFEIENKIIENKATSNNNEACLESIKHDNVSTDCQITSTKNDYKKDFNKIKTTNTSESLINENINMVNLNKANDKLISSNNSNKHKSNDEKNNEISFNNKNRGYPFQLIYCEDGCDNCKNIQFRKASNCAKDRDVNWSFNVRLSFSYIFCSNNLNDAIKNKRIQCFCNLCKKAIDETGADLINHIVTQHLKFNRFMFQCRLCSNFKSNDISVIERHWKDKHSRIRKFVNNFIARCQKYQVPDDFCVVISSRNNAKIVDNYKTFFINCYNFIKK